MWFPSPHNLLCLFLLSITLPNVAVAQISVVNGQSVFANTPVRTAPHGAPTMVWNCAKMPAICQNVNQRNQLTPRPAGGHAGLAGGQIMLHYDSDESRKDARGRAACPSSWRMNHACPEAAPRPVQPATVPQGAMLGGGSYAARPYNRAGKVQGDNGWNQIADANGGDSGMMWSCDEWPPKSTIQGGAGASTYCAPIGAACNGGGLNTLTEQNFQSFAQRNIGRIAAMGLPTGDIYAYWFKTVWYDDRDEPATSIEYNEDANTERVMAWQKRDLYELGTNASASPFYRVTEMYNDNETVSIRYRPLNEEEIKIHRRQLQEATDPDKAESKPSAQQNFEVLPRPPPLPIIDIAREFMADEIGINNDTDTDQTYLKAVLESSGSNHTNETLTPPTVLQAGSSPVEPRYTYNGHRLDRRLIGDFGATLGLGFGLGLEGSPGKVNDFLELEMSHSLLDKRQSLPRQCDASTPCPDDSCCNKQGRCGFGTANCGPNNCVSNCNATALCGKDSLDGAVKCPLNVCCGWYGYCGVEQDYCTGTGPDAPCQEGFGSCQIIAPPSCGGGSSASARTIGYYQVSNVRDRQCNRIRPSQIDTKGLTHLYLAFASINPSTFAVVPSHADDPALYTEFTGLKSSTLQTWVAIGGWDFNDPGATRTTFSDLARTPQRRARFITSLKAFLAQYGFQGVDIDWEYPGAPDRGGISEDVDNYVSLLREMRESFGSTYGISIAMPSSYWYLRWFKPKEMEPYVDWFGIMTYDLHGPWDANVRQIGKVVLGHTNVPEIANWTQPLWYDGISPSKVNMGLAYYARGYTVSSPNCNGVGCAWTSASRPAPCTNFGGVMSLQEIENIIIPQLGVQPELLADDMMMQLTWGNQWIGYDNLETIAMKRQWASDHCFGGTMIWSIDFYSGAGSGNTPDGGGSADPGNPGGGQDGGGSGVVYIGPEIWGERNPEVHCHPPCTLIMPPRSLASPTVITFPLLTTSLDVAWSIPGGTWTSIVQTTTLTIPPVTTTEIEVWAYTVYDTRTASSIWSTFGVTPSIRPPNFTITNDPNPLSESGVSHPPVTRTITPPPWPYSYTEPGATRPTNTATTTTGGDDDDDDGIIAWFPTPTWKPGPPGPLCRSGCGRPCLLFCNKPCLFDCIDGGSDFPDPKNPSPPPRPTPSFRPDPLPTKKPVPAPTVPPDPKGTDPQDEEQEDDDQACALEFGLPLPTYRPPTTSTSISPKPPAPTSSPAPPPDPPKPNPDTESVHCYDSGALVTRAMAIDALNAFCDAWVGTVLDASRPGTRRTIDNGDGFGAHCAGALGCFDTILISVTVKNGCRFTMGGKGANQECGRILRRIIDECDTSSTQHKQGGTVESNCASWRFDPNLYW